MLTSIEQSRKALEIITKAFKITKNIPLDVRFIVNSLSTLDTEIPMKYRYNGLVFFVVDAKINDGTTIVSENKIDGTIGKGPTTGNETLSGILYCFESDLSKPIPLHDLVLRFIIRQIGGYNNNWTNLISDLNHTYAKAGSIINVKDLGISVIFDGNDWKYFNGIYTINTIEDWNTVPNQLKETNRLVKVGNENKIILSDKTLSDEVIKVDSIPDIPENFRFYLINGYLYYSIGGNVYPVSDKIKIFYDTKLIIGDNTFTHNFNSKLLSTYCLINEAIDNQIINNDYKNREFPLEHIIIDENSINIKSSVQINNCNIILISKI